jgi:hypothetical protein
MYQAMLFIVHALGLLFLILAIILGMIGIGLIGHIPQGLSSLSYLVSGCGTLLVSALWVSRR